MPDWLRETSFATRHALIARRQRLGRIAHRLLFPTLVLTVAATDISIWLSIAGVSARTLLRGTRELAIERR